MENPRFDFKKESISPLGFGLMRLPVNSDGSIDEKHVCRMADSFLESGMNYFDTAYVYHGGFSERIFKRAVSDRHPRSSYKLATKLPIWQVKKHSDMQEMLEEQLKRTGLDFIDFYLIHSIDAGHNEFCEKYDAFEFIRKIKEQGKARHIGFSFHGDSALLRKLLSEHPEVEFVQLQLNYYDWDAIKAGELYNIALEHNTPVIIMEPVRGGMLSKLPEDAARILSSADPKASFASWALRWCSSLDGVMTVLSGMSNAEQMKDNLATYADFSPISDYERNAIEKVNGILKNRPTIPCTSCKYCSDCPQSIPIYSIFEKYNHYINTNQNLGMFRGAYQQLKPRGDSCIECGLCESLCPQGINIINELKAIERLVQ
ncbi:MAG: aldo/keto reductase [Clostridiales bacterium]|nr:aldo/keto reductase [Clostridiales bacterium]